MGRTTKWLMGIVGLALWGLVLGFVLFANSVTREPAPMLAYADGIVVFTGEGVRIKKAAGLLKAGRADKLLISGVNAKVQASELVSVTGLTQEQFDCCVTLGYKALNTLGNANETLNWARTHKLKSLIVVTSSYHMPRAMAELALTMPDTGLLAYDVLPSRFRKRAWWLHLDDTLVLVSEYLKFLPAAARVGVSQVHQAWKDSSNDHNSLTAQ